MLLQKRHLSERFPSSDIGTISRAVKFTLPKSTTETRLRPGTRASVSTCTQMSIKRHTAYFYFVCICIAVTCNERIRLRRVRTGVYRPLRPTPHAASNTYCDGSRGVTVVSRLGDTPPPTHAHHHQLQSRNIKKVIKWEVNTEYMSSPVQSTNIRRSYRRQLGALRQVQGCRRHSAFILQPGVKKTEDMKKKRTR